MMAPKITLLSAVGMSMLAQSLDRPWFVDVVQFGALGILGVVMLWRVIKTEPRQMELQAEANRRMLETFKEQMELERQSAERREDAMRADFRAANEAIAAQLQRLADNLGR